MLSKNGAGPVVVDFGAGGTTQPPTYAPPYVEDGFRVRTINQSEPGPEQDHFDVTNTALEPLTYLATGEREGVVHTGNDADEVIVDRFGAPLQLSSLEVEALVNPRAGAWEIVASNGATLTITDPGVLTFDSNWSDITSFTLRSTSVPDVDDFSGFLIFDNITLGTNAQEGLGLTWNATCGRTDSDYAVYEGLLGDWMSHQPVTCSTGGLTMATVIPGDGDLYYLVVPNAGGEEGSYGADSSGAPRPPSVVPCVAVQDPTGCP